MGKGKVIKIREETVLELEKFREYPKETWDSIIKRILKKCENQENQIQQLTKNISIPKEQKEEEIKKDVDAIPEEKQIQQEDDVEEKKNIAW